MHPLNYYSIRIACAIIECGNIYVVKRSFSYKTELQLQRISIQKIEFVLWKLVLVNRKKFHYYTGEITAHLVHALGI